MGTDRHHKNSKAMTYRNQGVSIINDYLIRLMGIGVRSIELKETVSTDANDIPISVYETVLSKSKITDMIVQYTITLNKDGRVLIGHANVAAVPRTEIDKINKTPQDKFNRIMYVPTTMVEDTWKYFMTTLIDYAVVHMADCSKTENR